MADEAKKPVVHLWALNQDKPGCGLIVLYPSGVIWRQQGGGTRCAHPEAEGIYLSLAASSEFPHICTWGTEALDEETRVTLGEVQAAIHAMDWPLTVDASRWSEAMEAWWPVIVNVRAGLNRLAPGIEYVDDSHPLYSFRGKPAILVTENCD